MTLSVSSLGKKTQTQRRSCMVLLLWKFSLFIFVWLLCLQPGLRAHWRAAPSATNNTSGVYFFFCHPELQPRRETARPTGSAGRAAATGQGIGTTAAGSYCRNTESRTSKVIHQPKISFREFDVSTQSWCNILKKCFRGCLRPVCCGATSLRERSH